MNKITIADFSGGIQEAYSPDDFTQRQWAELKGFIPQDVNNFRSQWPCQKIGAPGVNEDTLTGIFPLESSVGTFLVGISRVGEIYFTKVPATNVDYTVADNAVWHQISQAENYGYKSDGTAVSKLSVKYNSNYRFLCGLPLEVYKYVKEPLENRRQDFTQDIVPESLDDTVAQETFLSSSRVSAVLIAGRRQLIGSTFSSWEPSSATINGGPNVNPSSVPFFLENAQILVAFVDPRGSATDYTGVATAGEVRVISFPNLRRWPTYTRNYSATNADGTPISSWPEVTVDGVTYGTEERAYPIKPVVPTKAKPTGDTTTGFTDTFPGFTAKYPGTLHWFHPYTYKDIASALLPGSGIIPRGNVATMWGNQLIIGDIEWRADRAIDALSSKKVNTPQNSALLYLNDANTEYHRGSFYYSEDDIDKFDPRHVISVASGDARIAGMHMLDNRMICVTSYAGPNDGVIAVSGNLGQLLPYSGTANPFAIRKQLVRGGVGVADRPENDSGHRTQTCHWSDTGTVVFIDKSGAIYYTDGVMCDRLDRVGPKQPSTSTYYDHVASVGKHLFAYRNQRLLVMTLLESNGATGSGCWTEMIYPGSGSAGSIRSMVGSGTQLFMLVDGVVYRYTADAPANEFGCINGVKQTLSISSATLGDANGHVKTNWHRAGLTFYTSSSVTVKTFTAKAEAALLTGSPSPNPSPVPQYSKTLDDTYNVGHYNTVIPAGIGPQTVASFSFTMEGDVVLQGLSVWMTGGFMERGEP